MFNRQKTCQIYKRGEKNMTKTQKVYTQEENNKNKRNRVIKNSTYAVIVACSIMLGATLVAVNLNKNSNHTAVIQTSTNQTNYTCPITDCTVQKDYNADELQYNDTLKQWEIHKAVDLITTESANVVAIASGTVTNLYTNRLEGTVIEISHSNGFTSVYKSLDSNVKVKLGDYVKQGQVIGSTSNTMAREQNSGIHLHFELMLNKAYVNPNDYIDFSKK